MRVGREKDQSHFARGATIPAAAILMLLPGVAVAQGAESVYGQMGLYAGLGVGLVVLFIIVVVVLRKLNLGKDSSAMDGLTYLDVSGMTKTGLLTPEEAAKVRLAMQKQVERQRAGTVRHPVHGEVGLMSDPEILRLEALADANRKAGVRPLAGQESRAAAAAAVSGEIPQGVPAPDSRDALRPATSNADPQPRPVFAPPAQSAQPPSEAAAPAPELGMMGDAQSRVPTVAEPATPEAPLLSKSFSPGEEEVPLPAEVVKMAELGLITPEELERIKARIREKRQQMGS